LYVSQWFLLAALFWFPWIYSTANLLLEFTPVRGVAQASVAWWYANNLNAIWFGCVGLAAIFYFLPKLAARPLHSRNFALITFWTLVVFGAWGGVPAGAPLPAWMPCLSTVCTVLTSVAIVAVTINCHQTLAGQYSKLAASPTLRFVSLGAAAWVLGSVVVAITSLPDVGAVTEFTWFVAAQARVVAYGFFAMTMFGAIYYLLPRLVQAEWPSPKLVGLHFWSAALGTILYVGPLAIGGVLEGRRMNDATVAFLDASKPALPFLRVSTLGDLLMALGHLLLLVNICWLLARWWRARWELALRSWTIKQAEVEEVAS
jgi:cytochrome c oxidase cbb3-type subunit 1